MTITVGPPCDEGIARAYSPQGASAGKGRAVLATTVLGSSLAFIDGSVVNVALPALQSALDASAAVVQWIMNAYLLLLGALVLVGGVAADRYGRRRVFVLGVSIFAVASLALPLGSLFNSSTPSWKRTWPKLNNAGTWTFSF